MSSTQLGFSNRILALALLGVALLLFLSACDTLTAAQPNPTASLTVGTEPGGSAAVPLSDAVLYGVVSIHAEASRVEKASFYLDDRERSGTPYQVLSSSPFRLTLDTRALPDGPHTLTLELALTSGESQLSHPPFTIANAAGELLGYLNYVRADGFDCGSKGTFAGTSALKLVPRLIAAAQKHADDMHEHSY